jgi:hypothetical protein
VSGDPVEIEAATALLISAGEAAVSKANSLLMLVTAILTCAACSLSDFFIAMSLSYRPFTELIYELCARKS